MFHIESSLSDVDFAKLRFSEKLSLARDLAKSYGITVFFVMFVGLILIAMMSIVMFSFVDFSLLSASDKENLDSPLVLRFIRGAFFFVIVIGSICFLFTIGFNALILYYIDAYEPYSIFSVVMSPWSSLISVGPGLLLWMMAGLIFSYIMGLACFIPILGVIIAFVGSMFFLVVTCCATLNIADRVIYRDEDLSAWEAFSQPLRLVKNNLSSWLSVFAAAAVVSLPADLLLSLAFFMVADGRSGVFMLCLGLATVYFLAASPVMLFLVALTYKQSRAQEMEAGSGGPVGP